MNRIRTIITFCLVFCSLSPLFSQITLDQTDMPVAGDTLRVSVTNAVPAGYANTSMDTTWNYAALEAQSQRVDTFVTVSATPAAYQLFFVLLGGANLASPKTSSLIPGLPVSQGFTFFKNNATSFSDLGSAYTIQGIPLPAKYDIPDKQYQFPMTPGLTWASTSSFAITVPNLAYYSTQRIRSNLVDGWGTLTTPYGTFQTLRVKSMLTIHDSIYIDSLGAGFPVNRNIIEYKWLAKGKGIPVLQINEELNIATATYRDIYRMSAQPLSVSLGPDTAVLKGTVLTLHATVTGGTPPYQILWNTLDTGNTITVTVQDDQTYSVFVVDALQNFSLAQKKISVRFPPGLEELTSTKLQVYPNPSNGPVRFTLQEKNATAMMQVMDGHGNLIRKQHIEVVSGKIQTELSGLPDGIYFFRVVTENRIYAGKVQYVK